MRFTKNVCTGTVSKISKLSADKRSKIPSGLRKSSYILYFKPFVATDFRYVNVNEFFFLLNIKFHAEK